MRPDNHLLLCESIYTHRVPSLRCATPPRSAVFVAEEERPLHLWAHRRPPAAMSCKSSSGKARRESRSLRRRPQEGKRRITPSSGPAPQGLGFHPKKVIRERKRSE